ncbi:MAG: esterase/lipase family protein [Nitrospinota bacterium]
MAVCLTFLLVLGSLPIIVNALLYLFKTVVTLSRSGDLSFRTFFKSGTALLPAFIKESLYSYICLVLIVQDWIACRFVRSPSLKTSNDQNQSRLIILIHGFMATPAHMRILEKRISHLGQTALYRYRPSGINLDDISAGLVDFILLASNRYNIKDIVIIGHSFGGLLGVKAATKLAHRLNIISVIGLATPFKGSALARFAISKVAKSLQEKNYINKSDSTPLEFELTSIYSEHDQFVVPSDNSISDLAASNIKLSNIGHASFSFDLSVALMIEAIIRK